MKLVEIKDVRVGQVRKMADGIFYIDDDHGDLCRIDEKKQFKGLIHNDEGQLIGKLGITHRIEDNKLVEIPRTAEFQTDDVVKFKWDPRLYVINREIDFGIKKTHPDNSCFEATNDLYGSRQLIDFELKRVGILGVTHEFLNDREAANE